MVTPYIDEIMFNNSKYNEHIYGIDKTSNLICQSYCIYKTLRNLKPQLQRRYRQRAKQNITRLLKQYKQFINKNDGINIYENRDDIDKLNTLYNKIHNKIIMLYEIDLRIKWIVYEKLEIINPKGTIVPILRYDNGTIVPYGSIDYQILSNNIV